MTHPQDETLGDFAATACAYCERRLINAGMDLRKREDFGLVGRMGSGRAGDFAARTEFA